MTTQYNSGGRSSGGFFVFLLALVLGAVALGLFLRHAHNGAMARIASLITGRATTIDTTTPVVVEKIQRLNRLETVTYSLDTVIEGDKSSAILPDMLAGDKLVLIVHGESIAGVDMSKLKPEDVQITEAGDSRSIKIVLPASEIFVTAVDNQHSRVFARETGLLAATDANLESETRAKAQTELQTAALSDGILDAASRNARTTVTALLEGLGFDHVDVK